MLLKQLNLACSNLDKRIANKFKIDFTRTTINIQDDLFVIVNKQDNKSYFITQLANIFDDFILNNEINSFSYAIRTIWNFIKLSSFLTNKEIKNKVDIGIKELFLNIEKP